jgi:drug/metabolite transporter (DMT)-like permease
MNRGRGYLFILGAAFFWGISATVAKYLFTRDFDPLLVVQMRTTISCLILVPAFLAFRPRLMRVSPRDLPDLALLGIVGVAGSNFTYYFAIRETNVATAILLQYLAPVLVLGWAAMTREEKFTPLKAAAAAASLTGCFLAIAGDDLGVLRLSGPGLAAGLGAAFCWAFTNIWLRRLVKKYSVWTCLAWSFVFASLFWSCINPPWAIAAAGYGADTWSVLLLFAVISVLIPHSLYYNGVGRLSASRAIITATVEPILAIATAAIFVGERPGPARIVGAVMVLGAVALLQLRHEAETTGVPVAAQASQGSIADPPPPEPPGHAP